MKYKTIVADPPWQYRNKKTGRGMKHGASAKYSTMTTEAICDLAIIDQIVDKDCVLFLWSTVPMIPDALRVLINWGFDYKTALIWIKTRCLGMGFWFRVQFEICLIGKKGNAKPFHSQMPNLFFAYHSRHSRKPERFFQLIDPIIPRPAIELFAREKRKDWDSWGNEIQENEKHETYPQL